MGSKSIRCYKIIMSPIGSLSKGINSKIALVEKMAYGYRNKERLKTAIYFRSGNLQLYP
ncbi:MAG: hypothetical protein ACYDAO_08810 [Thermoplasmataceae archaeon]